ncbi:MAG: nucleotidyltransferase domain-containing protein [Planctomycetota bacterium]|nr:nucleotidyltransferase domain-containing protein [Planctomycetota bacterium]
MSEGIREAIQRAAGVLKELGAREVYVFGSAATGTMREGSDVDMAVTGLAPSVYFRAMAKAADALGREVDLIDLDADNLFTAYLKRKGKLQRVA